MRVSIIKPKKITSLMLPNSFEGSYWISDTDANGIKRNLISIEADGNRWKLISNKEVYIVKDNLNVPFEYLEYGHYYLIRNDVEKRDIWIFCSKDVNEYLYYDVTDVIASGIAIGGSNDSFVTLANLRGLFTIKLENNRIFIFDQGSEEGIYVNDVRVVGQKEINYGDVLFVGGIKIILLAQQGHTKLAIYMCIEVNDAVNVKTMPITAVLPEVSTFTEAEEELEYPLYDEKEYFHKKPRFVSSIKKLEMTVDAPPGKQEDGNSPFLLTIGPMITMSMTSLVTGFTAVNNLMNGDTTFQRALPSIVMCVAMFSSIFIWPIFTKRYEKRMQKKNEEKRQQKYSEYIDSKRKQITDAISEQERILRQNLPSTKETYEVIVNKYVTLWQRRIEDDDYLKVNLGSGACPMEIDIKYPDDHFSMIEDNLKEMVLKLGSEPKILNNVPIAFSFIKNYISGLIGEESIIGEYMRHLLLQILAFHSYDDLKIIILTDEEKEYQWKFLKMIPHLMSDDRTLRFFATNSDEYKEVCYYLEQVFNNRFENSKNGDGSVERFDKLYLIITDSFKKIRDFDIINSILKTKNYLGFSLFILDQKVTNLPDQCSNFIEINKDSGELCNNSHIDERLKFNIDLVETFDYEAVSRQLANIPIEFNNDEEGQLPNKLGFLEMYDVGKIEQLNALARWQNSNPMLNLSVPVGVGKNGEKINIDLHEKFHGPHGLIAGMTGSGKSEFIISYILSMAINFHPYEVQFILIDYKGGGLAGAFENSSIGLKLPHLVGTITNLDANEIKRSLSSIESELKRRQALFNKAREASGESTIDIYKYQKMYRDKVVDEPLSHLFIISDEFAELKNQEPEFMDQLISTARIGRSLGVHLILATQKPSGVVNPQIWSNTRFRICMKVQDKSDSNEIIKCPDAAYIKQTGRFFFQVGFNEVFVLGQAAWAGAKYIPSEKVNKTLDTSINFINNIGYPIKTVETRVKKEQVVASQGEELLNIVKYLDELAKSQNIVCRPLWLAKMPDVIKIEDLAIKYKYQKQNYVLNPIVGEYDVPNNQEQRLLTIPLTEQGNALIYGASGSGKENFITTLVYSSMLYYTAQEVNYYLIDFGAETLKIFGSCPIVGDILTSSDEDKIHNLFKMLNKLIDERKNLFAEYGGDYLNYCQNSGQSVPNIVVVINNFESYQETCSDLEDELIVISRESTKYGIYFVLTVNTPNGIRIKLHQNFTLTYALQQNSDDDYNTILGNVRRNYPAKIFGRGLIKTDSVYEFQTAMVDEKDKITNTIREKCKYLNENGAVKVPPIPVLPSKVGYKDIAQVFGKTKEIIIGIDKNELEPVGYDFTRNFATIISCLDIQLLSNFLNPFINQIVALNRSKLYVVNTEDVSLNKNYQKLYNYCDSNFDDFFNSLNELVKEKYQQYKDNNSNNEIFAKEKRITVIILGMETFKNKLKEENKKLLEELLSHAKEVGIFDFVIVDSIDRIKKMELDAWYKNSINNTNGIWIGPGVNDQFSIKINQKIPEMREEVPNNFAFVIVRGRAIYVKYIEDLELKV